MCVVWFSGCRKVPAELGRIQGVINDLQRELARLRKVQPEEFTISDDDQIHPSLSDIVSVSVEWEFPPARAGAPGGKAYRRSIQDPRFGG